MNKPLLPLAALAACVFVAAAPALAQNRQAPDVSAVKNDPGGGPSGGSVRLEQVEAQLGLSTTQDAQIAKQQEAAAAAIQGLVTRGLSASQALGSDDATIQARRADVETARASYQPTVAASGDANATRERDVAQSAQARTINEDLALTIKENLFHGGQDQKQIDIAGNDQRLAELTRTALAEQIDYQVRQAILQFNYNAMVAVFSNAAAKDATEFRELTERKSHAGQVGKVDVYTAAKREADAKATAVHAKLQLGEARFALLKNLGQTGDSDPALSQQLTVLGSVSLPFPAQAPTLANLPTQSLTEQSATTTADRGELTLSQAYRNRYLPSVDLSASATRSRTQTTADQSLVASYAVFPEVAQTIQYTIGVQFNWPLYERPLDYTITSAAAQRDAARATAAQARIDAQMAASTLRQHIGDLYGTLEPYKDAYLETGRLYDAQRKLYAAGAIDVFQVTDADSQRLTALRAWYDAVFATQQDLLRWQALGKGYVPPS